MSSISSAMNFSAGLSQTLSQGAQQSARAIEQNAARLDKRKEQISDQAMQAIQSTQATAQKMDEARNKIDTYA
jgi:methyl-accepting chemotaxis protein